jgi:hypothetical protein
MTGDSINPSALREQIMRSVQLCEEPELSFIHRVLSEVEKQQLWREIGDETEKDRLAGKWDNLPEVIKAVRRELRTSLTS